ncbi:MAG: lysophospholipid acyltransferase family protein [Candidatus Omnitrophota bacterium]|jgi:KDO2-lipid IV(A) lauroyltransferase
MFDYFLYRIGQFIALSLPLKIGYKIAVIVSDLHYTFAAKDRRTVKANLKAIFPEKTDREIRRIRIRMFRNFAKYLVDFFRFSKLDREYIKRNIKIENMHYFDQALAERKGVITVTAHLGNWELGGALIGILGYPFWVVALVHKDKRVNEFFNFQRKSKGVSVIPLGKAARQCLNVLRENKVLGLVGDRDFSANGGVKLDFFGKPTLFPEGPAIFALKTGAVIVPGFMLRNEDDSFTFRSEKPIEFAPTGNREKDILELIKRYKVIFEEYIRKYPDQWYMFRKFWAD